MIYLIGEPLWVEPNAQGPALEAKRRELEIALLRLTREADAYWEKPC